MSDPKLKLLRRFMPLIVAEYERIGIAEEMERYFTGSDGSFTEDSCEHSLRELQSIPSAIGFDAYRARVGMDAEEIRRYHQASIPPGAT